MSNEGTNSKVGRVRKPLRVMGMAQVGNAPQVGDPKTNVSEDWIRYGRSNLYPEFVRALADNCAPLDACVQKMALYIAGDGFEFLDENEQPIEVARKKWEELCGEDGPEALLYATGLDTALMNTHSWEVIYAVGGVPFQVAHMDVCRVRSGKKGSDGKVPTYFFCSNWEKAKTPTYKPIPIPAWGQKNDGKVVLYKRGYKQLRDYYGEPHWMAAMADAEVLARIPVFNRTQIDTGFRPAIHAHLQTNASEDELDDIDENFELRFTGDNGKAYILTVSAVNETLTVNKIERGDHAGELDATRKVSKSDLFESYGIPPILMGVDVNTGLSGKGLAISESLSMFQTTVVGPMQKPICHSAKLVLAACGIDVPIVRIKPLKPFQPAQDPALVRQTFLRDRMVGESRIASGMPVLTTDGKDPAEDRSNWTEWMLKPLIEVGSNPNGGADQNADTNVNKDANA